MEKNAGTQPVPNNNNNVHNNNSNNKPVTNATTNNTNASAIHHPSHHHPHHHSNPKFVKPVERIEPAPDNVAEPTELGEGETTVASADDSKVD